MQGVTHGVEGCNLLIKLPDLLNRHLLRGVTVFGSAGRQLEQCLHFSERESELLRAFDEPDCLDAVVVIGAVTGFLPLGRREYAPGARNSEGSER